MSPHLAAANVLMAALLIGQTALWHPAVAFAHGERRWWPLALPAATLTLPSGGQEPLVQPDGKGTLLVMGSTQCGSTCITTMERLQRVFAMQPGLADAWRVRFVSIAVGQEDAVAAGCFSSYFDPRFTGGTLAPEETGQLVAALRFRTWQVPGPQGRPVWRHEPRVDVIDPYGRWLATYPGHAEAGMLAGDLARWRRRRGSDRAG